MTTATLSPVDHEAAFRLAEAGRHAELLTFLQSWPVETVEASPALALLCGTAHARLGRHALGLRWVETALSGARREGDGAIERRALNARGAISLVTGRVDEGADYFTQGLLAASRDNDLAGIGRCASNIGVINNLQGRQAEAISSYAMAVAAYASAGMHGGVAECHHNLSITYREQDHLDRALAEALRAADAAEASGDAGLQALTLRGRAEVRVARQEWTAARREIQLALERQRALGDRLQEAESLRILAAVLAAEGQLADAEATLRDVIARAEEMERPQLVAEATRDLALLLHKQGRDREARDAARKAKRIFAQLGAVYELRKLAEHEWEDEFAAELRQVLAPLHAAQRMADSGHYAELVRYLSVRPYDELERSPTLSLLRAVGHARLGQTDAARQWALIALTRARARGDRAVEVRALNVSGAIALEMGGVDEAVHFFDRAREEAMLENDLSTVGRASNNLGVIANMQGDYGRAVGAYTMAIAAYQHAHAERGVAESQHNLGITFRDQGKLTNALQAADEAIRGATRAGDASLKAQALAGRAEIRVVQGDARVARREAERAAEAHRTLNDPVREAEDKRILANAMAASGQIDEAMALLREVTERARVYTRPLLVATAQRDLALLLARTGARGEARDVAEQARATLLELGAAVEARKLEHFLGGSAA